MDETLIYFLIGCIAWAALLYYIFVVRKAADLGAGGISALVVVSAVLIPVLGLALWSQSQSFSRLEDLGFEIHEGLDSSVGVATGTGAEPTWLYSLSTSGSAVLDFYRRPVNHKGWTLTSDTSESLVFERGESKMRLQIRNGNAAFLLFDSEQAEPNKPLEPDA